MEGVVAGTEKEVADAATDAGAVKAVVVGVVVVAAVVVVVMAAVMVLGAALRRSEIKKDCDCPAPRPRRVGTESY